MSDPAKIGVSRRTLAKGAAWTVPAAAVVAAAPAYAVSLRKDPGINGWVNNSYEDAGRCAHQITVISNPVNAGPTPDGAPFGLYLYDIERGANVTINEAKMTYWLRGSGVGPQQTLWASWASLNGHSPCWGSPVQGTPQAKSDGEVYTPYTWTYNCPINSSQVGNDGRLRLGAFRVRTNFTLASSLCDMACFYVQRSIKVDGQELTFERKRGFNDCDGQVINRKAPDTRIQQLSERRADLEAELKQAQAADQNKGEGEDSAAQIKALQDEIASLESKKAELASAATADADPEEGAAATSPDAELTNIDERLSALEAQEAELSKSAAKAQARTATRGVEAIEAELEQIEKELASLQSTAQQEVRSPNAQIPA